MPDKCYKCRYNTKYFVCHPHCSGCDGTSKYERGYQMNWNECARAVHQNAVEHGWWEGERDAAEIFALIHSELSEALEEYRSGRPNEWYACEECFGGGKPCDPEDQYDCANYSFKEKCEHRSKKPEGVAVELADCVIRILDYCGKEQIDIGGELSERRAGFDSYTLPALVNACHCLIAGAYENEKEMPVFFAECIAIIRFWCEENDADLEEVIAIKHEYNKSRPYRHGGKKC